MKKVISISILLVTALLFVPKVQAQGLSKYRAFSLGTSLSQLSKQIDQRPGDATLVQQSPATIQELVWRPFAEANPVEKVVFSFYNATLYKMTVTYDSSSTEGLTSDDMVRALSRTYGVATIPPVAASSQSSLAYPIPPTIIAHWEDSQYSIDLARESFFNAFHLVIYTKHVNDQAEASIVAAAASEKADAPQQELARIQKAADDLETARQNNIKAFRP